VDSVVLLDFRLLNTLVAVYLLSFKNYLSSEFCSFPHMVVVHILLDLKYFILWCAVANGNVLLILNSTCSLLAYRKLIDFYILTLHPEANYHFLVPGIVLPIPSDFSI
jgi:hypothetical protein